ncbi:GIY-YIG endonuclease [Rhizophagus irregularis DAOM 181602=DAOM 197198]|nr:GIY-YIG endonuclease [Rhizophagus irregularis DAOM 181602=DAOM 197198]
MEYQLLFHNIGNLENPTAGSTLGISLSVEARAKLRAAHLGKTHSLETRQLMSETRRGSNNSMFGKTHSEETKMSAAKQEHLIPWMIFHYLIIPLWKGETSSFSLRHLW